MSRHSGGSGHVDPSDALVALDALEQARADLVLAALAQPALRSELAGEDASVAAITARIRASAPPGRSAPRSSLGRPAAVRWTLSWPRRPMLRSLAVACCLFAAMSGAAFAGVLPGAAQQVAHQMLSRIGVDVPGPNGHAADHPNTRGASAADPKPVHRGAKGGGRSSHAGGASGSNPDHPTGQPTDPGKSDSHPAPAPAGGSRPTPPPAPTTGGGSSHAGSPPAQSHDR